MFGLSARLTTVNLSIKLFIMDELTPFDVSPEFFKKPDKSNTLFLLFFPSGIRHAM